MVESLALAANHPICIDKRFLSYLEFGWCLPNLNTVWSTGQHSVLWLPLAIPIAQDAWLELALHLNPLIEKKQLPSQTLQLTVAGHHLGTWELSCATWIKLHLPSSYLQDGICRLELHVPKATSLAQLGVNKDRLVLGVQLLGLRLNQVQGLDLETNYPIDQQILPYLISGWKLPETGFVWSSGHDSRLWLPLAHPLQKGTWLELRLKLNPLSKKGLLDAQTVQLE